MPSASNRVFAAFGPFGVIVWPLIFVLFACLLFNDIMLARAPTGDARVGRDFVNVWEGGRVAAREGAAIVYDRDLYRAHLAQDLEVRGIYAFSYPPHMLLLSIPFGQMGYYAALTIWIIGGLAVFWIAARPWLLDAGLPSWAALILPAGLVNIWAGHFGHIIGALGLIGWRLARTRPAGSGLAFALMTVKPHMGLLVPPMLVVSRCHRTIGWAFLGVAILAVVSIKVLGLDSWYDWLTSTLPFQASLVGADNANMAYLYMMPTVERLASAILSTDNGVIAVQVITASLTVAVLGWAARSGICLGDLALLSFVAIFLILPYSFIYDMTAASLAILVLAHRFQPRLGAAGKTVFAAAFVAPLLHYPMARAGLPYSPIAMLGVLLVSTRMMVRERKLSVIGP